MDGTHRCKTCRWDRLNASDKNCWRCGARELESIEPEIRIECDDDAMDRLRSLARGVNDTWPYTGTSSLTRYQCGLCDGVHYANKAPDVWPCGCTRFYEAS